MAAKVGREDEIDERPLGQVDLGLFSVGSRGTDGENIARIHIAVGLVFADSTAGTGVHQHSAHTEHRSPEEYPDGNEDHHNAFHDRQKIVQKVKISKL